ncbi:MAG: response regulator [Candidatus Omnitrophica bacterium]|nr:response regulator [Candidatus Omnitrophota bacterium]
MKRILLVDDEKQILETMRRFLEKKGFETVTASSGKEALEVVDSGEKPDVGVFDIKMPGMNGFECLKKIREKGIDFPVIFLTGSLNKMAHMDELRAVGCTTEDMVHKPIDMNVIMEEINKKTG